MEWQSIGTAFVMIFAMSPSVGFEHWPGLETFNMQRLEGLDDVGYTQHIWGSMHA